VGVNLRAEINKPLHQACLPVVESSLDFDAYWKAWLASRLAEMREKAARARQMQEMEEQEAGEEGDGSVEEEF
jgi:hypothetical protein